MTNKVRIKSKRGAIYTGIFAGRVRDERGKWFFKLIDVTFKTHHYSSAMLPVTGYSII